MNLAYYSLRVQNIPIDDLCSEWRDLCPRYILQDVHV